MAINNRCKRFNAVQFVIVYIIVMQTIDVCNGHGRLIDPPGRSTAYRYGFPTPPNYDDNGLFCGGFVHQYKQNAGRCGVCGDAWDDPEPRPNEYGGKYGRGVIVKKYAPNSVITMRVDITAYHLG